MNNKSKLIDDYKKEISDILTKIGDGLGDKVLGSLSSKMNTIESHIDKGVNIFNKADESISTFVIGNRTNIENLISNTKQLEVKGDMVSKEVSSLNSSIKDLNKSVSTNLVSIKAMKEPLEGVVLSNNSFKVILDKSKNRINEVNKTVDAINLEINDFKQVLGTISSKNEDILNHFLNLENIEKQHYEKSKADIDSIKRMVPMFQQVLSTQTKTQNILIWAGIFIFISFALNLYFISTLNKFS